MEAYRTHVHREKFVENLTYQQCHWHENRTKLFYVLSSVGLDKPYLVKLKDEFQEEILQVCNQPETPISQSKHIILEEK